MNIKALLLSLVFVITAIALAFISPAEATLGVNARIVYLHGAWVWAALIGFIAAGLAGAAGLLTRREKLGLGSRALARSGLVFWITYLPISLWAMQTNWNGLFLAEPRWRIALIFAVGGTLLQIGLTLIEKPIWDSLINPIFVLALFGVLQTTEKVLHPPSPMLDSQAWRIQTFFAGQTLFLTLAVFQLARWFYSLKR
ncbi:MAG: hypothetical protein ABFS03_10620 [Chloroflexota bacterium]